MLKSIFSSPDRWATVVRYLITIVAGQIALQLGLDANQTGDLTQWLFTGVMGVLTFAPMVWNLIFRPSDAAMEVAAEADKMMDGAVDKSVTVKTPAGVPDITVAPKKAG